MTETGMAVMVIALGGLLVVGGICLIAIILKEKQWWERLIVQMLAMPLPDIGSLGPAMPMIQQMLQMLAKRIFKIINVAVIAGGAGVSTIGVVLILVGSYIWS